MLQDQSVEQIRSKVKDCINDPRLVIGVLMKHLPIYMNTKDLIYYAHYNSEERVLLVFVYPTIHIAVTISNAENDLAIIVEHCKFG